MAQPPFSAAEPLVVILGSTGTGKSDLAVDLACRFNGEVINADAMQMYRGLPVTTNKITAAEQRGVPHHLLGTIGLDEPTWQVWRFRQEAARVIRGIRDRRRLPIVVGGSHYYIDGLLFDDHLVAERTTAAMGGSSATSDTEVDGEASDVDNGDRFPILNDTTEAMLAQLREVDPAMADHWHPHDRRKIRRSLEIFLTTGRRASDIYSEQRKRRAQRRKAESTEAAAADGPSDQRSWKNCLLIWVYARPDVLDARLDARVDSMLARGLLEETAAMHDKLREWAAAGRVVDRSKGIWQSIGFKELEPFWAAVRRATSATETDTTSALVTARVDGEPAVAQAWQAGLDGIRFGTHRYARHQLQWLRQKTIPRLAGEQALDRLYLLDGTDRAQWPATVAATGARLTATFLSGDTAGDTAGTLPRPVDVSDTACKVLTATIEAALAAGGDGGRAAAVQKTCDVCQTTLVTDEQWMKHIRGHRHRRAVQKKAKWALVPTDVRATLEHKGKQ